jgi:DNA-binding response OmpR family regulator
MLPDIDGLGVCEILRQEAETAVIPILMLTAWATTDARKVGLELGALDYLTKPFSPRELTLRVEWVFSRRGNAQSGQACAEPQAGDLARTIGAN